MELCTRMEEKEQENRRGGAKNPMDTSPLFAHDS
jgi:hypothetical protein